MSARRQASAARLAAQRRSRAEQSTAGPTRLNIKDRIPRRCYVCRVTDLTGVPALVCEECR